MEEIITKSGKRIICENGTLIVESKRKEEILHIHTFTPNVAMWIFENDSLSKVEQIRVLTVSYEDYGHDCHIEYVHMSCLGYYEVWNGGDCTPMDACNSWLFRGNVITADIFDYLYFEREDCKQTHEELYDSLLYQVKTYWPELQLAPGLLEYCKEKDKAPS